MDDATYQRWWRLHVRIARGDVPEPDERAFYDAMSRELERDELFRPLEGAKQARRELRAFETDRTHLEERRHQLDVEIAALESNLTQQTRQVLGAEE